MRQVKSYLLSVIIPVYNAEKTLNTCVDSIIEASKEHFKQIEIVLINDGSPDNSSNVCDDYAKKYNNVKVIHQQNQGVSAARNAGIKSATGEWITFCDSDDYVLPNFIKIFDYIENEKDVNVITVGMTKNGEVMSTFNEKRVGNNYEDLLYMAKNQLSICCVSKIVRRKFVLENDIFFPSGTKSEDYAWSNMLMLRSDKSLLTNLVYYVYVDNGESVTHTYKYQGFLDQFLNANRVKKMYDAINMTKKQRKKLYGYLFQSVIYQAYVAYKKLENDKFRELIKANKDVIVKPHKLKSKLFYYYMKMFYLK